MSRDLSRSMRSPSALELSHRDKTKQKIAWTRYLVLLSLVAIMAIYISTFFFREDAFLGLYGFVATSLIFIPFLLAYTKYRDTSDPRNLPIYARQYRHSPLISIIVPTKNDAVIIKEAVHAFLQSTYKNMEIILVNDGSTDDTGKVMDSLQKENPEKVRVIHLPRNMGKRKAMKEGIHRHDPKSEIIFVADSDSVPDKFAIEKLVRALDDPSVGAATAHVRARNADENILTKMQDIWYDTQTAINTAMDSSLDSVRCCPGCLSAYRKEAILSCLDQWSEDWFAGQRFEHGDDRHLTSYVLGGTKHYIDKQAPAWKVHYCSSAICYSEAPSTLRQMIRQNIRWKKSWFRVAFFNIPFFFKGRSPIAFIYFYVETALTFFTTIIVVRSLILLPLQGNFEHAAMYITAMSFVGLLYGLESKIRNPDSDRWAYRIPMTLLGAFVLDLLLYYAILTIKDNSWSTR